HKDNDHRRGARDLERQSAARHGIGCDPDPDRAGHQCRRLGHPGLVATADGLTMRGPVSDLPLVLDNVAPQAGRPALLDRISLTITPGAPTLVVGPNGSGKTSLLRLCMGLATPTSGDLTWGGRAVAAPTRRAFVFQRPVMLRRTAAANVTYALAQTG